MLYQCSANLPGSASGDSPKFENGGQRFTRGVLKFAIGIGVRSLNAELAGKLKNGLIEGQINGLLDLRMDWQPILARRVS